MAIKNKFYEFIEIDYSNLSNQINTWLAQVYKKSGINFNSASPYGQILNVLKELFQHNIIYLKNAVKVLDINQTQNIKVARYTARIAGHNPSRAISATGTLKFQLKSGVDIEKDIKDSVLIINNGLSIKNKSNSLKYLAYLNVEKNIYPITTNSRFFIPIIQGTYENQTFTGIGRENSSISVNIPGLKQIENFNYTITYNGIVLTVADHLYDMLPASYSCYVRSGFNGGLDVYFGNKNFGFIPQVGSSINVSYILSDGSAGEILNPLPNDWKIEGEIKDGQGNTVDVAKYFDIFIENDINFASDGESLSFTKAAIPYVSRNFVLGTPNQFIFHLKRLNMFSKVNAYNKLDDNDYTVSSKVVEDSIKKITNSINNNDSRDKVIANLNNFTTVYNKFKTNLNDNEIYLYLIPDVQKYFNDNINYFNIPYDVFYLDNYEKDKITKYLRTMGTLSMTTEINIIQPKITKYVMHVYVRRFDYANEDNIKQQIITSLSDYLIKNTRFDRLPKADFIGLIKSVDGVDSASVYFVGQKNEDYHKNAMDLGYIDTPIASKYEAPNNLSYTANLPYRKNAPTILSQGTITKNGVSRPNLAYDPKLSLGIDTVHGDIICEKDEYVVIRGGWRDRNGIWYNEDVNDNSLCSINVVFNGVTTK